VTPIIISMGDPTGIGPEIIVKALSAGDLDGFSRPLVVAGDPGVLLRAARLFEPGAVLESPERTECCLQLGPRKLRIQSLSRLEAERIRYGQPDLACGVAMADYIDWAANQCIRGDAAAIVTCPINKAAINAAGIRFPGHTELLAQRCGVDRVVMMLAGEKLKVCLVTTHLALTQVPAALSSEGILATIRIVDNAFRRQFQLARPHLAVLALNPHAGEDGLFGDEEQRLIAPAIATARQERIEASGPHSADTLFHFAARGDYDAVICMYHDQGLIPLKLLHFEDAVNVTLGLPIVRTSVDHGTAYDLAGTGRASTRSLLAALRMASRMI